MSGATKSFTSSAAQVATVTGAGVVTATGPGTAEITTSVSAGGTTLTTVTPVTVVVAPGTATVTAPQFDFTPEIVDIAAGGVVTWSMGAIHHTVAFSTGGSPADLPELENASASRTFASNGTFAYRCTIHPAMRGEVRVH
jgi:plastocyanin